MRQSRGRGVLDADTVAAYLARIGVDDPGEPSLDAMCALHRAHVERVPYEVLDIQLGRLTSADPLAAVERIVRGRGGYCVQLNGGFSTLMTALGYEVVPHGALMQAGAAPPGPGLPSAPHLAPTIVIDGEHWLADVGLGDGLHDPLPLHEGTFRQGPFTFRLGPSRTLPGGWRFDHDERGSIRGMDFTLEHAPQRDFDDWHVELATSPESRLVRALTVMRREATGADQLTGCMLRRVDADGRTVTEVADREAWFDVVTGKFGLRLDDIDAADRARLWDIVHRAHEAWLEAKARRKSA